jgi:hypothetical protein
MVVRAAKAGEPLEPVRGDIFGHQLDKVPAPAARMEPAALGGGRALQAVLEPV